MFQSSDLIKQYIRRLALDLALIPLAFYLAWFIRFDCSPSFQELQTLTWYLLPIAIVYIIINGAFGIYRHLWAFASFRDIILLSEATGLGTLILLVFNLALTGYRNCRFSIGGLIIGGLLTLILSTAFKYRRQLITIFIATWSRSAHTDTERVLIVGVNETAQQLATQIYLKRSKANYELVGFVDDNPYRYGMSVSGVEILGTTQQLPSLVCDKHIDVIIIARRPADQEQMWRLISTCRETVAQVKVLPDLAQVVDGCYQDPLALRDVSIDDLLGRQAVTAGAEACQRILAGKVVLVTGAAGSIGSELCRQILCLKPRLLVALDNNETGLYDLNLDLNRDGQLPLQLIIADVSDWNKMNRVFKQWKPQIVFHAAAYKHVPLVECHPDEALRVNIMGTAIVSEAAHEYGAERFVFISTDKAVNPSSVMGASKRIGEMWIKAMSKRSDTVFTSVRFGNVIGSRGSVLPTFTRQIELGGPVTVTHPEMHRFFISIPEAVSLVLQAVTFSAGGEIFMLDMGEEVSILSLAQHMIRLKGLRVNKDIEVKFVGIRPGEKLHEELAYKYEPKAKTPHPRIYSLQCPDGLIDHDTLLGVISILTQCSVLPDGVQCVCDGIFQIAEYDIDGFLNQVTGLNLRDKRQLPSASQAARGEKSVVWSGRPTLIADGAVATASP
jgi:FlaA1/EpsC-like NDP-sugar epimerase